MRERRTNRSHNVVEALRLWLTSRAKQRGSQALVVGTDDGMVVAAPASVDGDLVAAFGATKARGQKVAGAERLSAQRLTVDGQGLVVTAVGGPPLAKGEVDGDVGRILRVA